MIRFEPNELLEEPLKSENMLTKVSEEQEREIRAVDVKRRRSDLFHNLSSFYRCHI